MSDAKATRVVKAVHGLKQVTDDPAFEIGMAAHLAAEYGRDAYAELYQRFIAGEGKLDSMMRRVVCRAVAKSFGHGVSVGSQAEFKHLETFEIGNGVFVGAGSYLQGRFDGRCVIGDHVWIGPHSYFDARDLVLEEYVGWGPGAKVLGSQHTGIPYDVPVVQTELEIKPVRLGAWADIGTGAVILPGVTIGKGAVIGAGAVVNHDVPDFAIYAGVPAKFLKWREGYEPK